MIFTPKLSKKKKINKQMRKNPNSTCCHPKTCETGLRIRGGMIRNNVANVKTKNAVALRQK